MKNIIMSIIFLGLLGYIFYDRNQKNKLREGVVNKKPWPAFIGRMQHNFPTALVAPNKTIYSTHVFNTSAKVDFSFGRTESMKKIQDSRAFSYIGTDITIATLQNAVVGIVPGVIAKSVKKGEKVFIYTKKGSWTSEIRSVSGEIQTWYSAQAGESSGVVTNAKGEIITLYSLASGIGPNLVAIRDLFE